MPERKDEEPDIVAEAIRKASAAAATGVDVTKERKPDRPKPEPSKADKEK